MTWGPVARPLAIGLGALLVLIAVMWVRALVDARAASLRAERAAVHGDLDAVTSELRAAARWAAPINPYASDALTSLERLGAAARERGDVGLALLHYRSAHAAIHAGRSFYTPHREQLERIDRAIVALMLEQRPAELDAQLTPAELRGLYADALVVHRPRSYAVILALGGFFAWVSGALVFMTRGLDAEGRLARRTAKLSALAVVLGWIAFAFGLRTS